MKSSEPSAASPDRPSADPRSFGLVRKPRLGISSCLLGEEVRFDGGHKNDRFLRGLLEEHVEWAPLCPEVEIGLGTPRESLRLIGDREAPRMIAPRSGLDHTESMRSWSRARMPDLEKADLDGYVLKKGSPSCGLFRVRVYSENGMPERVGRGLFADELAAAFPLLPLEEEGRLHDAPLRENFVERIYNYARWKRFLREDRTVGGLVRFHTAHKLILMAHAPAAYRDLGRLVGGAGDRGADFEDILTRYAEGFARAHERRISRGKHTNVLHHLLGFLKNELSGPEKQEILGVLEDFRRGIIPLSVPLTLMRHHLKVHDVPEWVHQQVYLNPYPKEMMLRNHV